MTNIHWAQALNGDFANAANWSGDGTPGAGDNAVLDAVGNAFTVSSSVNEVVMGVQLTGNATLAISGGTFTASAGTDGGVNAGVIAITAGADLAIGGTIDNVGGITLSGAGSMGSTMSLTSNTTLIGGGLISLVSNGYSNEVAIAGANNISLTNIDNTIAGYGDIGASPGFHLINETGGVIEATGGYKALTLGSQPQPGLKITNRGIIEAASGSALHIYGATISGHGGQIVTQSAAVVSLVSCKLNNQTVETAADSSIDFVSCVMTTQGAIQNASGVRLENSTAMLTGSTTLSGGGYLDLSSGAQINGGSGVMLQNEDNRIGVAGGDLGGGNLAILNSAGGYISGYGVIDSGMNTIINAGAIVASNARVPNATLVISSPFENDGTLIAGGSVGDATLVVQGAVTGAGDVIIQSGVFGGSVADFASTFNEEVSFIQQGHSGNGVNPVSTLELSQSENYSGSISGFSSKSLTALDLDDIAFIAPTEATFSGALASGELTVSDGVHTAQLTLIGNFSTSTFTAASDGHGGTTVIAIPAASSHATQTFAASMASLGGPPALSDHGRETWSTRSFGDTILSSNSHSRMN